MADRRFTEEEGARVLKRAAELQRREHLGDGAFGLADLEEAAEAAGIDRALVRRAALSSTRSGVARGSAMLRAVFGAPFSVRHEIELEGEITTEQHEHFAHVVQRALGEPGQMSAVGRSFSFHTVNPNRTMTVTVSSRNGRTFVVAEGKFGNLAGGLFGGVGGGVGGGITPLIAIGAATLGGPVLATAASVVFFSGVWGLTRYGYKKMVGEHDDKLRSVVEEIAEVVGETVVRRDSTSLEAARESLGLSSAATEGSSVAVPIESLIGKRR